jgi:hypothetical protein
MMASTRIMAGIVSVFLSSLTLLAGSASAECAWVLWTETQERSLKPKPDPKYGKGEPTWKFDHNVHDTRAACEAVLSREMDATVKVFRSAGAQLFQPPGEAPDFFIRTGERRITIQKQNDWFLIYNYACLPDTLDPRGPKGK